MATPLLRTAIIIHTAIVLVYSSLIYARRSSLSPAVIPVIFFVPVFGFLSALVADGTNMFKHKLGSPGEIETVKLEKDIYWKSIRKQDQAENIVPLEEALIINDRQTRKQLVLEMLLDDPMKNIDILLLARENNDVDTAHYANTTIAKIQRDFQLQVQKLGAAHESDPQNMEILDKYIQTLTGYIQSGLSEAYLLRRQRIVLAALLDEKIEAVGWSEEILQQKIENALELKDINTASEVNSILLENYPSEEQTWLNEVKISISSHDANRLQKTIELIKHSDINWTNQGKEQMSAWVELA